MQGKVVVGIDGGGTQTSCTFRDMASATGKKRFHERDPVRVAGTNPTAVGLNEMRSRLRDLLRSGIQYYGVEPSNIAAVCAGIAGLRVEAVRQLAEQELARIGAELGFGATTSYTVTTDKHIALQGALHPGQRSGILVIAGTGSSALGIAKGKLYTCGGWGHKLGDEGSGYAIGMKALQAICRAHDQRVAPTLLKGLVLEHLGLTEVDELIAYFHDSCPSKEEIAELSKLVVAAAQHSDAQAAAILDQATDDLIDLVRGLSRQTSGFGLQPCVYGAGSIVNRVERVRTRFASGLQREGLGILTEPSGSALDGAVSLAWASTQS
ncbi:BadF/BadG/BcrA/BcrD ATPase family protein [Paenibacillus illinoisensis]|uniref:N-acetylglucosamine kinase n=1 Tax=Paenibacillus illinoisensis TaxID=59845 RepID=UPI003D28B340